MKSILDWKDIHNDILFRLEYHEHDEQLKKMIKHELSDIDDTVPLDRKKSDQFYLMLCYLPLEKLLKLGFLDAAEEIIHDMKIHLQRKRKQWNYRLFLDFTHIFHRCKWRHEVFPHNSIMEEYDLLCGKWFEKYGEEFLLSWVNERRNSSKTLKNLKTDTISKIDMSMQFMKLLGTKVDANLEEKIVSLVQKKHTYQTEHLYMLLLILENS
jgi:hypothetical protein